MLVNVVVLGVGWHVVGTRNRSNLILNCLTEQSAAQPPVCKAPNIYLARLNREVVRAKLGQLMNRPDR